jgi:hypothetical protein
VAGLENAYITGNVPRQECQGRSALYLREHVARADMVLDNGGCFSSQYLGTMDEPIANNVLLLPGVTNFYG